MFGDQLGQYVDPLGGGVFVESGVAEGQSLDLLLVIGLDLINRADSCQARGDDPTGNVLQTELLLGCDAVLLGWLTYQSFASVWQGQSGDPYTDQMNAMAKYVVSTTLDEPDWTNTTVISDDLVTEVTRLKDQPGKDIVQYGFGGISHTLMEHGLLDEIRLWVHPFFVGGDGSDHLLFQTGPQVKLDLTDTTALKSGIVIMTYQVDPADAAAKT